MRLQACKLHNDTSQAKKTYATSTVWTDLFDSCWTAETDCSSAVRSTGSNYLIKITKISLADNIHRKISGDSTLKSHGLEARCPLHPRCLAGIIGGARLERLIPRLPHMMKSKLGYLRPIGMVQTLFFSGPI